jgi:hypothetical protein
VIYLEKSLLKRTLFYISLALVLLVGVSTACGRGEQRPAQQEKKESIPAPLMKIVENSQAIIQQMEKLQQEEQKPVQQQDQGGQEGGRGGEDGGGQGGGQEGGQGSRGEAGKIQSSRGETGGGQDGQGGGDQGSPSPEQEKQRIIEKIWEDTLKTVEDTHKQWNDYENTAVKDNARDDSIRKFEAHLNSLTVAVNQRDPLAVMNEANGMSLVAADFLALYRNNPDSEIVRVGHYLQQTCIDSRQDKWDNARRSVSSAKQAVGKLEQKVKLEEADKGLMNKLRLSIDNLGSAMEDRDLDLLKIKKDIALENLEEVEKKAK